MNSRVIKSSEGDGCTGLRATASLYVIMISEVTVAESFIFNQALWISYKGLTADALASEGEEGRGKLR